MKKLFNKTLFSAIFFFCFAASEPTQNSPLFFTPAMIATHLAGYNEEDLQLIEKDLGVVRSVCFTGKKTPENRKPIYLATAGPPGARKSTILERFIHSHPEYSDTVYVDPDQRGLRFMAHTYHDKSLSALELAKDENFGQVQKLAYEKWRGASNYIALTLLEEAFAQRKDIAHGTTSTGGYLFTFLPLLKKAGYESVFLICNAEDRFRQEVINYRNKVQEFYQSTPEDVINKGKLFAERMPVYFAQADTIYLFWSDSLSTPERLAAVLKEGHLEILDHEAYALYVGKFEKDRVLLQKEGKQIPEWQEILNSYLHR